MNIRRSLRIIFRNKIYSFLNILGAGNRNYFGCTYLSLGGK